MEKVIQFTEEQKSLIWRTKIQPMGGTGDEAKIFIEVCERYGLDPILGDIVFTRYETKNGPVTNFIVTRDAYLKAAMRDKSYVKCVSAVIHEGDDFELDIEGNVKHKFGKKRGNIVGAWAYAEHATRGKLPVVVDFLENFRANAKSQNGRNAVWDSRPSAMIQKVAEVYALRRQFPLGGIVTAEEMGMEETVFETVQEPNADVGSGTVPTEPKKAEIEQTKKESKTEKTAKKEKKEETKHVKPPKQEEEQKEDKQPTQSQPVTEKVERTPVATKEETAETQEGTKQDNQPPVKKEGDSNADASFYQEFTVLGIRDGKTPQGTKFSKVAVQDGTGRKLIAYAREEVLNLLDEVEDGQTYLFDIQNVNGYDYLIDVGGLVRA